MSIFKLKNLKGNTLIEKIVYMANLTSGYKNNVTSSKNNFLTAEQLQFVEKVSNGMTEREVSALKESIKVNPSIIKNYIKRNMLKDASTGQLKPMSQFAVDIKYPARGFRAIKSIS